MSDNQKKYIGCPVCRDTYNSEFKVPRLFRNCGHSICEECLSKLIKTGRDREVFCPVCKTSESFNPLVWKISFPVNFGLKDVFDGNPECGDSMRPHICETHDASANQMCLDPNCRSTVINCPSCIIERHLSCNSMYAIDVSDFERKATFDNYSVDPKAIDESLSSLQRVYHDKLDYLLNSFSDFLKRQMTKVDLRSLQNNKDNFKVEISSQVNNTKAITFVISPKNKTEIDEAFSVKAIEKQLRGEWKKLVRGMNEFFLDHLESHSLKVSPAAKFFFTLGK
jgi:hypothetical protein